MSDKEHIEILILGSGPAGYTAAIYAARAGYKPVVYTGMEMGGQLTTTTEVENYPGFPEGIQGPELMERMKKQAERFGTDVRFGMATAVEFSKEKGGKHKVIIDNSKEVTADVVIIATGASAMYLGLESEQRLRGGGVSACATCDGFFYRDQRVAVVGGGDVAAEEALYLSNIAKNVKMLIRRDQMRASKIMQDRVFKKDNIDVMWNTEVKEVLGDKVVEGLRVVNNKTGEEEEIPLEGLFVAIGHKPNTDIFKGQIDLDERGYIITKPKSTQTNLPGVFAAGDVQDPHYQQAVTAAATGSMAAIDAEAYLNELKG
ncbi:MAG: thioredoxin-disulfide reductase [Chlorobi bacterium]|nr:thioredoxin-disulfide reductase [Chlorobiota bacterium]